MRALLEYYLQKGKGSPARADKPEERNCAMKRAGKKMAALVLAATIACIMLAACSGQQTGSSSSASSSAAKDATSLKDDPEEAKRQIEVAMKHQLEQAYGDKVNDAKIYVEKVYTTEQEQADELLKSYNLGPDEVAFEVKYELHPVDGVDVNSLTAATGQYDEKTGWVIDKYNVGILRPNPDGEPAYIVTDFGTGF